MELDKLTVMQTMQNDTSTLTYSYFTDRITKEQYDEYVEIIRTNFKLVFDHPGLTVPTTILKGYSAIIDKVNEEQKFAFENLKATMEKLTGQDVSVVTLNSVEELEDYLDQLAEPNLDITGNNVGNGGSGSIH